MLCVSDGKAGVTWVFRKSEILTRGEEGERRQWATGVNIGWTLHLGVG